MTNKSLLEELISVNQILCLRYNKKSINKVPNLKLPSNFLLNENRSKNENRKKVLSLLRISLLLDFINILSSSEIEKITQRIFFN